MAVTGGFEVFKLFGSVFLEGSDKTKTDLDGIDKKAGGIGATMSKVGAGVAKAGVMIGTAAIAIGSAVVGLATKVSESSSRINDLSQKIGISKTAFQEWDYMTKQTGASVESLQMGVKTLSKAAYEAAQGSALYADSFKALGIEVKNTDGTLKDQEVLLNETITALAGMENETERTALASQLLGKSATELSPLLNGGSDSIAAMRQEAHDLGIVLSDETVTAGDEFGDTMDKLKATVGSLIVKALGPMMPVLTDIMNQFLVILPPLLAFIAPLIEKLMPVVQTLIAKLLPVFLKLLDALMPILDPLIEIFVMLVDEALVPMLDLVTELIIAAMPIFVDLLKALIPVLKPLLTLLAPLIDLLMILIEPLLKLIQIVLPPLAVLLAKYLEWYIPKLVIAFQWLADVVNKYVLNAFNSLKPVIEGLKQYFSGIIDFVTGIFTGNWKKAWEGVKKIFSGIWDGLVSVMKIPINVIITGLNAFIGAMNKIKIPSWVPLIGGKGFSIPLIPKLEKGLSYVPYDEFPAILHKGERVMTAAENKATSVNSESQTVIININNAKLFNQNDARELANLIYTRWKLAGVT